MKKIIIILFFLSTAQADVNLQTGGLVKAYLDFQVTLNSKNYKNIAFKFNRIYRSRSTLNSFFGYGWCSILDEKIHHNNDRLEIFICADEQIISLKRIKKYLWKNSNYQLKFNLNSYTLSNNEGIEKSYSQDGWLISEKNKFKIQRQKDGTPTAITVGTYHFNILSDQLTNLISEIKAIESIQLTYKYKINRLYQVLENKRISQSYSYDEDDNMTEIRDKENVIKINYDKQNDRVNQTQSNLSCTKVYVYDQMNSNELVTRVFSKCQKSLVLINEYHFWYEDIADGIVKLKKYEKTKHTVEVSSET